MAKTIGPRRVVAVPRIGTRSHAGQAVQNRILRNLPTKEWRVVSSKLDFVEFPTHCVLNEMAKRIRYGYFINGGLASVLNVMPNGKSVEVGLTGEEGFVGLPLLVGFTTSPTLAVTQIAGSAFRVSAADLAVLLLKCPQLSQLALRYSQEFALQVTQVAACNRLHNVNQRMARWLLMSKDRVPGSSFLLTQEFLSHMLGTRRASVTIAAGALQRAGLITYQRGKVTIVKRAGLETAACDCYRVLRRQLKRWSSDFC